MWTHLAGKQTHVVRKEQTNLHAVYIVCGGLWSGKYSGSRKGRDSQAEVIRLVAQIEGRTNAQIFT